MKQMKRTLVLALALVICVSIFAGCGQPDGSEAGTPASTTPASSAPSGGSQAEVPQSEAEPTVIHMANDGDCGSMSPYGAEGVRQNFIRTVYETLGRRTAAPELEMQYVLAKEVTEVEPNVYDVTIYDYIKDSAGEHMTADDVVFSFEQFKEAGVDLKYISSLKSVEAVDTYTARFTLENPRAGALEAMFENIRIITKASWEASGDGMAAHPVGTAPYVLDEYVPGSYARFVKAESYWQTDESKVAFTSLSNTDVIYVDVTPDAAAQAISLQTGELNTSQYIKSQDLTNFVNDDLTAKDGYNVIAGTLAKSYILVYNCSDNSPCADINLRKAIAACLDKVQLASKAWGIIGIPSETVISTFCKDYPTDFESRYAFDVEAAKEYLAQSSYQGETLKLLVYNDYSSEAATLFQAYCLAIGINVELLQYDKAQYTALSNDNSGTQYDMELCAPFGAGYAWDQMAIFNESNYDNGLPHTCLADPKLQELYNSMASAETNSVEATRAFCDYVDEMCYGIGIGTYRKLTICTDNVTNLLLTQTAAIVPGACIMTG